MERLTFEGNFCEIARCKEVKCPYDTACSQKQVWERLKQYEDTGLSPVACEESAKIEKGLSEGGYSTSRMVELMCADQEGRVVVLPCKVGDTVWAIENPWTGKLLKNPIEAYANGMKKFSHGLCVNVLFDTRKINGTRDYETNHIGKTIFFTREEAERAMEELNKT